MTLNKKSCLIFCAVILILLLGVTVTTAAAVQNENNTQAIKDNGKLSTSTNNDVGTVVQSSVSITNKDSKVKNKNITTQTTNTENKQITKKTVTNTKLFTAYDSSSSISKAEPIQKSVGYDTNDIYIGNYAINEKSTNPSTMYMFEINREKLGSEITVKMPTKTAVQIMNNTAGNVTINVAITNETDETITTGFFNVSVAGKTRTVKVKDVNTMVKLDVANAGEVSVSVKYLEGDIYAESIGINNETMEEFTNITVVKQKTGLTLNINPNDTFIGETVTISGQLIDGSGNPVDNALITVKVNSSEYLTKTGSDGSYSINNITVANGTIPVQVSYDGNDALDKVNITGSFKVNKIPTVTLVSLVNSTVDNVTLAVEVIDAENNPVRSGLIQVTSPIETSTVQVLGEKTIIPLRIEEAGTFKMNVKYIENNVYLNSTGLNKTQYPEHTVTVKNITVYKQNTTLSVGVITPVKAGNKTVVSGILVDEQGKAMPDKDIIVLVDGRNVGSSITVSDGSYTFELDTVIGTHTVTGSYEGNKKYYQSSNNATLVVEYTNTTISINPNVDVTIGDIVNITGKLVDEFYNPLGGAAIKVTFDTTSRDVTTKGDGSFNASFDASSVGSKAVKVEFAGNDTHTCSEDNSEIGIVPVVATITTTLPNDAKVGDTKVINGTVIDKNGNHLKDVSVNVTVNNKIYTTNTDENGKYDVSVDNIVSGLNNVTVSAGNEKVMAQNLTDKFIAYKKTTNITINKISDVTFGENVTINGTLTDEEGNILANATIRVKVGDKEKSVRTDKDGNYNASFVANNAGPTLVKVYYDGNDTFEGSQESGVFEVNKKSGIVTVNVPANAHVGDTINVTGSLKDIDGEYLADEPVEVKVNGKPYKTNTDKNGNYAVLISDFEEGINYISVSVPNSNVNAPPVEKNFTVTKKNTCITVQDIPDVPVGTTVAISGTLTDETGEIVPNADITVTVNGIIETVKSDSNGMYKFNYPTTMVKQENVVVEYAGNQTFNGSKKSTSFNIEKANATLTVDKVTATSLNDNITVTGILVDKNNKPISNAPVTIIVNGKNKIVNTDAAGNYKLPVANAVNGKNNVTVKYESDNFNSVTNTTDFTLRKLKTTVTVESVVGTLGEDITLIAHVTDENGNNVSGGNLLFKLNGRSLREDGRFDTTGNPLKLKVKDGLVTFTMKADLYFRNGKNVTASYSGSNKYEAAKGNVAIVNIRKRTAQVTVTVTPEMTKQNTYVMFTATLADITKNAKNTTCLTKGTIIFKVNGKTLKDENGNIIRLQVTHDVVNYAYHIDSGTASIYSNKTLRNYTVEAVYDNELFSDARNTTVYNVERSPVNIKFNNTTVQNNVLSVKATLKDYEGNNVVGNTKICIKINGITYTENGQAKYFTIKNGNVDLSDIKISNSTKVKSVMIVAGENSAYLTARESTTEIKTI